MARLLATKRSVSVKDVSSGLAADAAGAAPASSEPAAASAASSPLVRPSSSSLSPCAGASAAAGAAASAAGAGPHGSGTGERMARPSVASAPKPRKSGVTVRLKASSPAATKMVEAMISPSAPRGPCSHR